MSNQLLSMGSQSKPPVLMADEYQQWKKRMIQFLNHKNREYMAHRNSAKEVWDELSRQFEGSEASIQAKAESMHKCIRGISYKRRRDVARDLQQIQHHSQ
ncbi:hypothetical protein L6452_31911 [Arctium lappa]|uniref:Uncharacterized protein n=1 Tax=Arctium lappa TaxID=4217 RepID=A0ACB8Z2U2_ARCLA|nr:hypothetical protein L6452_31911 [Arctium lappa]